MPPLFYERVRKMRICASIQLVSIIALLVTAGVLVECVFTKAQFAVVCILLFILCVLILAVVLCNGYIKRQPCGLKIYDIPIGTGDVESVAEALSASPIGEGAYVSFCKKRNISVRVLIQSAAGFDRKVFSDQRKRLNRKINKANQISTEVPLHEALSSLRINLVVCDRRNAELIAWVGNNTERMLQRNEAVISAAVITEEKKLLFPACINNLTIAELNRYEAAGTLLYEGLSQAGKME